MTLAPAETGTDWFRTVLLERGYLARIRGEAIKVYLVMLSACGGSPGRSVTLSVPEIMRRTRLSYPTVQASLKQLTTLGLVVSKENKVGRTRTYEVPDPPSRVSA